MKLKKINGNSHLSEAERRREGSCGLEGLETRRRRKAKQQRGSGILGPETTKATQQTSEGSIVDRKAYCGLEAIRGSTLVGRSRVCGGSSDWSDTRCQG